MASRTNGGASRKTARQFAESGHCGQLTADEAGVVLGLAFAMITAPQLDEPTSSKRMLAAPTEQRTNIVKRVLSTISERDRKTLRSFFLQEPTETQIQSLISRAKARFEDQRGLSSARLSVPARKAKDARLFAGRALPIAAHAVAVFGDEQKAAHWFATPLALLGGRSPEEAFYDEGGAETVDRILTRIEHNIPS